MTDQHIPSDLLHRAKVIDGLVELAAYLEAHPDVPVCPYGWDLNIYTQDEDDAASRAEVDRIAALLGAPVQDDTGRGGHYVAGRSFGLISYRAVHVSARRSAAYNALMSYHDCVTPADAEVA